VSYNVPKTELCDEQIIKKSRFITHVTRATNKTEAKLYIQSIKSLYPDARHHCWAYIAGHPTATTDIGFSDDGEPSGTAGKPILNVLQHRGVGEIVLVVVRYFGGIKLGAGGLVRAYSSSASLAMDKLETEVLTPSKIFTLNFSYPLETSIKHLLDTYQVNIIQAVYTDQISLTFSLNEKDITPVGKQLNNITAGKVSLTST